MGIRKKFILFILSGYIVINAFSIFFANRFLVSYSQREYDNKIRVIGENVVSSIKSPLFYSDYNLMFEKMKTVALDQFDYFTIYDNISKSIAFESSKIITKDYILQSINNELDQNIDLLNKRILHADQKYLEYIFTIRLEDSRIGYVFIGVSWDMLNSRLSEYSNIVFGFGILSLLVFVFFILFLTHKIVSPLKELSLKMQEFAAGDKNVRTEIQTGDEIQQLSENFNVMAESIANQISSIENRSFNLKKEVDNRTRDLENASLRLEENEIQIQKMKKLSSLNSLVGSIAHHINNPLTVIQGNIQMLENKVEDTQLKNRLKKISLYSDKILRLIDDISLFANLKDTTYTTFTVSDFLINLTSKLLNKEYKLEIEGDDKLRIFSDNNLVYICIKNILANAIQIIENRKKEKYIHIKYLKENHHICFEITDRGGGVENISRIFEPFYTSFEQKKGLGLSFVYHISRLLEGSVSAENLEDGAKFTLKISVVIA